MATFLLHGSSRFNGVDWETISPRGDTCVWPAKSTWLIHSNTLLYESDICSAEELKYVKFMWVCSNYIICLGLAMEAWIPKRDMLSGILLPWTFDASFDLYHLIVPLIPQSNQLIHQLWQIRGAVLYELYYRTLRDAGGMLMEMDLQGPFSIFFEAESFTSCLNCYNGLKLCYNLPSLTFTMFPCDLNFGSKQMLSMELLSITLTRRCEHFTPSCLFDTGIIEDFVIHVETFYSVKPSALAYVASYQGDCTQSVGSFLIAEWFIFDVSSQICYISTPRLCVQACWTVLIRVSLLF